MIKDVLLCSNTTEPTVGKTSLHLWSCTRLPASQNTWLRVCQHMGQLMLTHSHVSGSTVDTGLILRLALEDNLKAGVHTSV